MHGKWKTVREVLPRSHFQSGYIHNHTDYTCSAPYQCIGCLDRLNTMRWALMRFLSNNKIELVLAFPNDCLVWPSIQIWLMMIHLWNMWKRNFKSTQAYRQHKGGVLHIVISSLLEYEITQNASLRLIWSQTAFRVVATPVPAAYPNIGSFSPVCDIMFPGGVGSLRVFGVLESRDSRES